MTPAPSPAPGTADRAAIAYLRSAAAIRERCAAVFAAVADGMSPHFELRLDRLAETAEYVAETTRARYPSLQVPFHSRWRHFAAGGIDRWGRLAAQLEGLPPREVARIRVDLAVTSVLLDAGAGERWRYVETETGQGFARSEGLAVASFDLFAAGEFSADPRQRFRADADALLAFDAKRLARGFQVSGDNPLAGLEGRATLLWNLGRAMHARPDLFGETQPRIGALVDYLLARAEGGRLAAAEILRIMLEAFAPIWPGRITLAGANLGDVGRHPAARSADATNGIVPFHKLSQWLTYSLIEPLEHAGLKVVGLDALTGLPEYRNGGLFLDMGVLTPKRQGDLERIHTVGSELVVEWRAVTVILLDRVAELIRELLGRDAVSLPLAKVLEGGTWSAGRRIAADRRVTGAPPLQIESDGTVF